MYLFAALLDLLVDQSLGPVSGAVGCSVCRPVGVSVGLSIGCYFGRSVCPLAPLFLVALSMLSIGLSVGPLQELVALFSAGLSVGLSVVGCSFGWSLSPTISLWVTLAVDMFDCLFVNRLTIAA